MTNKMTKREAFTLLTSALDGMTIERKDEIRDVLAREIENLNKRAENKKPSAKDIQTQVYRDRLIEIVAASSEPMTIADIKKADEMFKDMNSQQVSGLLKPLVDPDVENHPLQRIVVKRVMHVTLA